MSDNRLRRFLWESDPICFWCGVETIWVFQEGGDMPWNACTLDHYFSKYVMELRKRWGSPIVLACNRCNQRRGAEETKQQPLEELWKRSSQHQESIPLDFYFLLSRVK